jgi:hypothetical protein
VSQDEPPPGRVNRSIVFAGLCAAALVLLAGLGWVLYDGFLRTDPGIAACESIRDGRVITAGTDNDQTLSEEEYREARAQFEKSDHERIREHGTQLMDVVWNLSNLPAGQEMNALGCVGPLTTHAQGLQSAYADEGIIFNLNDRLGN